MSLPPVLPTTLTNTLEPIAENEVFFTPTYSPKINQINPFSRKVSEYQSTRVNIPMNIYDLMVIEDAKREGEEKKKKQGKKKEKQKAMFDYLNE